MQVRSTVIVTIAITLMATCAHAIDNIQFTKVAGFETLIPGEASTFTSFYPPAISNGKVAFRGFKAAQQGIFVWDSGAIQTVADWNTAIPGGSTTFQVTTPPSFDGQSVAFIGQPRDGVYSNRNGVLEAVADPSTPVPSGSGNFNAFLGFFPAGFNVSISDGQIAFRGIGSDSVDRASILAVRTV